MGHPRRRVLAIFGWNLSAYYVPKAQPEAPPTSSFGRRRSVKPTPLERVSMLPSLRKYPSYTRAAGIAITRGQEDAPAAEYYWHTGGSQQDHTRLSGFTSSQCTEEALWESRDRADDFDPKRAAAGSQTNICSASEPSDPLFHCGVVQNYQRKKARRAADKVARTRGGTRHRSGTTEMSVCQGSKWKSRAWASNTMTT